MLIRVACLLLCSGLATGSGRADCAPPICEPERGDPQRHGAALAALQQSLQDLINQREPLSLTDYAHRLLVRTDGGALQELACPIASPTRDFPYPHFSQLGPRGEAHPGQATLALLKALGPDGLIRPMTGAYSVRELVEGERYKASHYRVLATIRRCLREPDGLQGSCRREILSADLDQAWFIELMARDLHLNGHPLETQWVDEEGHLLSLLDFLRGQALLLERLHRPGEPWLLAEYGFHALNAMAVVLGLTDGTGTIPPDERLRYQSLVERKSAELLNLTLGPSSLSPVYRLMLAGHLLEFLLSPDTYEGYLGALDPDLQGPRKEGPPCVVVDLAEEIAQILRPAGDQDLPLGVLSHALSGVRMLGAAPARSQRDCLIAHPRAARSASPCRP